MKLQPGCSSSANWWNLAHRGRNQRLRVEPIASGNLLVKLATDAKFSFVFSACIVMDSHCSAVNVQGLKLR
jgi:hypothetical protein